MLFVRKYLPIRISLTILIAMVLLLAACTPAAQAPAAATAVPVTGNNNAAASPTTASSIPEGLTPAVKVSDQAITNGTVTVDNVTSPGPGWIVIHINSNGTPGEIIGWSQVKAGVNPKVTITVDATKATAVLYAMLHVDAGKVGVYEFPGPDAPIMYQGQMVSPAFAATGGSGGAGATAATPAATSAAAAAPTTGAAATNTPGSAYGTADTATPAAGGSSASGSPTVTTADNPKLGKILVDSKGMTLYIFKKDTPGKSNCTGGCLENWPPLLITSGSPVGGPGISGKFNTFARTDNGTQVTYNDQPLYYFAADKAPGDVNGQGVGNNWFAATP